MLALQSLSQPSRELWNEHCPAKPLKPSLSHQMQDALGRVCPKARPLAAAEADLNEL